MKTPGDFAMDYIHWKRAMTPESIRDLGKYHPQSLLKFTAGEDYVNPYELRDRVRTQYLNMEPERGKYIVQRGTLVNWYIGGQHTLTLSPGLWMAFEKTEIGSDLKASDLYLPYDAVQIVVPEEKYTGQVLELDADAWAFNNFFYTPTIGLKAIFLTKKITPAGRIDLGISIMYYTDKFPYNNMSAGAFIQVSPDENLMAVTNEGNNRHMLKSEEAIPQVAWFFGLLAKVMLYLDRSGTSCGKEQHSRSEPRPWSNSRITNVVLGANIKVRQLSSEEKETGHVATREGHKLKYCHNRVGHFFNQAYGPGRALRRRRWRKPTIVGLGKGLSIMVVKDYLLEFPIEDDE